MKGLLAGLLAASLVACAGPGKGEAVSLTQTVDRWRGANGASRAAMQQAVADVVCTEPRVCQAKATCLEAIEPTTRALALKDEVTRRLADVEQKRLAPDSPEASALPDQLDQAERLLREGREKMAGCDTKLAELRAAFGT